MGRILSALAGDLPGYEEACRALYAVDRPRFDRLIVDWPREIYEYLERCAEEAFRC
jgi:hypothetical protein